MITEYKTRRRDEGAAAQTVNQELAMLRHAFNLAIREWVRDNPAQKVSREKVKNLIERWLTLEEEEKLLAISPKWFQEILLLGIETGLRQSELLGLRWPQVNLSRGILDILEQKNKGTDTLPLSQKALEVLKARDKARYISSDLVFFTGRGTAISARNLLRAFYSAREKSGSRGSGGMTLPAIPSPHGLSRTGRISTPCKSWGDGRAFPWLCGMHTTTLAVCVLGLRF